MDETLNLKIGARYKIRLSAVNGAGLTAVHYTDGLLVDPTPPEVCLAYPCTFACTHTCMFYIPLACSFCVIQKQVTTLNILQAMVELITTVRPYKQ